MKRKEEERGKSRKRERREGRERLGRERREREAVTTSSVLKTEHCGLVLCWRQYNLGSNGKLYTTYFAIGCFLLYFSLDPYCTSQEAPPLFMYFIAVGQSIPH